jgi:hypothetical protein
MMPLIVSKQIVNMVEIRIELPELKILTSMVTSENPPISTQSTFDFPYFPLLSPFFLAFFYGEIPHGFSHGFSGSPSPSRPTLQFGAGGAGGDPHVVDEPGRHRAYGTEFYF